MSLNQFIDTGADDATVNDMKKSIAREEDLQKAMNKAGLVQKEVQVKGKNGQMFTRKQWVKASDAATQNVAGGTTKVNKETSKTNTPVSLKGSKLLLYNGKNNIPYSLSNAAFGFNENMRRTKFPHIKNTGYQDSAQAFKEIVESASPTGQSICDALNSSGIGFRNWKVLSESNDKIIIQASDSLGNKTNLAVYPKDVETKNDSNTSTDDVSKKVDDLVKQYSKADYDIQAAKFSHDANAETRARSRRTEAQKKLKELGYKPQKSKDVKGLFTAQKIEDSTLKDKSSGKQSGRFKREDFKLPKSGNRGNADELLSMVNKLDESCSVVGIRPEIITGHGTFIVKTYKITGKPGSELEVRYGSDAQGVYFIADGEKYRDVNSLVEHIKSSGSMTDKSSSTSKKANKNTNLTSKISGIPEFRDIKYDNKSNFTFTDKDGNKVSGKTVDARTLKPGDTVLLYNGIYVQAIGTVTDTSVETLDSRSIHSRKAVSITIETADGKSLGGFSDSEPDFSVRKITKVEDAISGQSQSKSDTETSSGKFKPSDFQFRSGGQDVADFVNSIDKELGVKKHANGNVGFGTLSLENGASVNFGYDDTGAYATWNGSKFRDAKSLKSAMSGQKSDQGKMNHQTGVREKKAATMIEDYFAGNHSHDDGKKALANLLGKGYTRDDIMAQAEKSGVTWKKNDHAGINWMRASMAIQKYLTNKDTKDSNNEKADKKSADVPKYTSLPTESPDSIKSLYSNTKNTGRVNATFIYNKSKEIIEKTGTISGSNKVILNKAINQVASDNAFQSMMNKYSSGLERDIVYNYIGFYIKNNGFGTSSKPDKICESLAKKHNATLSDIYSRCDKLYDEFIAQEDSNRFNIVDNEFVKVSKELISDSARKYRG